MATAPSRPPGRTIHSKRALALDQVETMRALGFERFAVAGHDRGAWVAHRLARDHPEHIERMALLDIVPTLYRFETIDQKAATSSWHWFFLIQPRGFPERLIGAEAEFFLRHQLSALLRDPAKLEPEAFAEYLRCFRNPETIRATCDEYRAGASIDLIHDRADRGRKLAMPLFVLWGQRSSQGSGYDVLAVWREHAENGHRPWHRQRPLPPGRGAGRNLPGAAQLFRRQGGLKATDTESRRTTNEWGAIALFSFSRGRAAFVDSTRRFRCFRTRQIKH